VYGLLIQSRGGQSGQSKYGQYAREFSSLLPEGVELQHYDFGTDATSSTPAEICDYVTNMFLSRFRA